MRHWWAQAAAQRPDCYLRSTFYDDPDGKSHVLVALRPPAEPPPAPQRLRTVGWVRPFAHLKHVGTFAQTRHGREARQAGYDDALRVTAASEVAETTIANIGFVREGQVIWPSGPALHGIVQQLLEQALLDGARPARRPPVLLADLPSYEGAFLANSIGVVPVAQVDGYRFAGPGEALTCDTFGRPVRRRLTDLRFHSSHGVILCTNRGRKVA